MHRLGRRPVLSRPTELKQRRAAARTVSAPKSPAKTPPANLYRTQLQAAVESAAAAPHVAPRVLALSRRLPGVPFATLVRMCRLKQSTEGQYLDALNRFRRYADAQGWAAASSAAELDGQLELFAINLFLSRGGAARQTAACARLAFQWANPALKGCLPLSGGFTALTAWNNAAGRVVQRRPPITWPLALVVARNASDAGDCATAAAIVVAFAALLRISEAAAIRICDVLEVSRAERALVRDGAPQLVLAIHGAKTAAAGEAQSAYVLDPAAAATLQLWLDLRVAAGALPTDLLFERTQTELGSAFAAAVARSLGSRLNYTWHSLRHGGATRLFMAGWSTAEVMRQGRWLHAASAWRYQQSGRAAAAAHDTSQSIVDRGEELSQMMGSELPARPWAARRARK